jgi:hypothetical protein
MDVKTGAIITAEAGLLQMQPHPSDSAKDMKDLNFLIKGTQAAAKQFMQCVAQSGHKAHNSQLQQSVAVDSFGETGGSESSGLDPAPKMIADPDHDGKKCKYQPGKKNDGALRTFKMKGKQATLEACSKSCADDPKCVAFSAIFGQWCIGCEGELMGGHKGAKAFEKTFEKAPKPEPETVGPQRPKPEPETGGPDPKPEGGGMVTATMKPMTIPPPEKHVDPPGAIGGGMVTATVKPITIPPPEKHVDPPGAIETGGPDPEPTLGEKFNCFTREKWSSRKTRWCCKKKGLGCKREPRKKDRSNAGGLSDEAGVEGGKPLTAEDALRDENDEAVMDAAEAIKNGAATPEQCEAEKKALEETYVKTFVELSRLRDEYSELANSTACEDNVKSIYNSRKTPLQEKIDELIDAIDKKTSELQNLRPRLESATDSEKALRKHIATLGEECAQLPETVSDLDKVRDSIEALSRCPGLSRVQFSIPKWIGTWVKVGLKAKKMTDDEIDAALNAACAKAAEGSRAAEIGEIEEQTLEGMPETNTADLPLVGACPNCAGDEAADFPSGHKRICFRQGKDLNHKGKATNCAAGKKAVLCVMDRENIRQVPGES